jgi:LPS-assembly protein
LNAPGEVPPATAGGLATPLQFNQVRTQIQYGRADKRGLSAAATFGLDVRTGLAQYYIIQSTYNWDCCGINVEYRRIALGAIRDENQYRFTYTLANIGAFGNLMRRERLY